MLAGFVGVWSYAVGHEVRAPTAVPVFGYTLSEKAAANLAYSSFANREAKAPGGRVKAVEKALANRAYRSEPLSVPALGILARSMATEGETAKGAAVFELAGKLSRRNFLVSSELIKLSATRDNPQLFFTWLSRVMLTNDSARKGYSLAMADATARDDAVKALIPVLGAAPRWSDDYWESVVTRPASLTNAAALRMDLTRRPWRQVEVTKTDGKLIAELVNNRQFDTAERLAVTLGLPKNPGLVRNGDFSSMPAFSPFDWELAMLGNLGASINADDKNLSISAIGGARGLAAQQLFRLAPGNFRLGWTLSGNIPAEGTQLWLRISCAEAGVQGTAPLSIPLQAGKKAQSIAICGSNCRWHWLSVVADVPDDAPGFDAYIDNVSLIPAS